MTFRIPTILFVLFPRKFISDLPEDFNLKYFSEFEYEWKRDPLWGLWDIAQSPSETIEKKSGDCVDYARLASSYLVQNTNKSVEIYVLFKFSLREPGHMIVFDGNQTYSSGNIRWEDVEEYADDNNYKVVFRRSVQ